MTKTTKKYISTADKTRTSHQILQISYLDEQGKCHVLVQKFCPEEKIICPISGTEDRTLSTLLYFNI